MTSDPTVLGIDVGSVAVSIVELDARGAIVRTAYGYHQGQVRGTLARLLDGTNLDRIRAVGATSVTPATVRRSVTVDTQLAIIEAAENRHRAIGSLLVVGGERFSLVRFDADGTYRDTKTNSSCAAGTGSFLDQQAKNLGLEDGAALAEEALRASGSPPKIASRCAVFAKTDLIHAQQEGHSRADICDGLCKGLANIVADAALAGDPALGPIVMAGGVARNAAVRAHLEARLGSRILVDADAHLYGALGVALRAATSSVRMQLHTIADLVAEPVADRTTFHPPLELRSSSYPDLGGEHRYVYAPQAVERAEAVEVDVYERIETETALDVFVGLDIGSTSTKAVLLDDARRVVAGLYTRTAGRPLYAVRGLFEAIDAWATENRIELRVRAAGTTGSGRKLAGAVIGGDLAVDEITAHARAAYELDPEIDTIIEIGGQDAKFTTLSDGMVTSAVMNTVCAAGTGSFIEEQARRLGVPLEVYADTVAGARAPLGSDRCTVFMQRDVNHLLSSGYEVREILATVLHAVRENYLTKVARQGSIGERVCFQGATAKNRALVAAFEQRLGKPIAVSKYCHLTGALGTALMLAEAPPASTSFRGFALYATPIPLRSEVCELCKNHCKIVVAEVGGETAAYGFLCGRDYDVSRFVSNNRSGFDLIKTRRKHLRWRESTTRRFGVTVGLPVALPMADDVDLWRRFFHNLGVETVTSERCGDPVGSGKSLARAELCAPMVAFHGHVAWLADRTDVIFAPVFLEAERPDHVTRRQYCYYTQFASALADTIVEPSLAGRVIRPLITDGGEFQLWARLYTTLRPVLGDGLTYAQVSAAHSEAAELIAERRARLRAVMRAELESAEDVSVVILGRPYAAVTPSMNSGIPEILGALGVKTFFQDMLAIEAAEVEPIGELLARVHWQYASKILAAAFVVSNRPALYPVLVTSFKCAPDSFTIDLFRRIMDAAGKPYLILELDELDSSVGYETRLEAAVRAFRNHAARPRQPPARTGLITPSVGASIGDRSVYVPSWDRLSCSLVAANLRREGLDARAIPETPDTIQKGMRHNGGQCIPLNAIVQGFIEAVDARGIDPGRAALWMMSSQIACNIGMYPTAFKALLEAEGRGFERSVVVCGELTFVDVSVRAAINTYFAYVFGGALRQLACRVRPYEKRAGDADAAVEEGLAIFVDAFEGSRDKLDAARRVVDIFAAIETSERDRPQVAIFGDLYSRDNDVFNQGLIRLIEEHGGEVITTPYSEYVKLVAQAYFKRWWDEGKLLSVVVNRSLLIAAKVLEREYVSEFARVLGPPPPPTRSVDLDELLARLGLTTHHTGESVDNILKLAHIAAVHPEVSLFVQANPAFCCPSLVTEAMAGRLKELTGVPIVTITYDGTSASRNEAVVPYLEMARRRRSARGARTA
jgi:predicted CoA-substrate-specific enzyme activase